MNEDESRCYGNWTILFIQAFKGSEKADDFVKLKEFMTKDLSADINTVTNYRYWWDRVKKTPVEYIYATPNYSPIKLIYQGGVPSVLVQREHVESGAFQELVLKRIKGCSAFQCTRIEIYNDVTGNVGSPQPEGTSISSSFRTAIYHVVMGMSNEKQTEEMYALGTHTYFGESAYWLNNASTRYWGDNYDRLYQIKLAQDPNLVFNCHLCVGNSHAAYLQSLFGLFLTLFILA